MNDDYEASLMREAIDRTVKQIFPAMAAQAATMYPRAVAIERDDIAEIEDFARARLLKANGLE